MKILQLSTYDIKGGAAKAAYRLHLGLRSMGQDCRMLVKEKSSDDPFVFPAACGQERPAKAFFLKVPIQEYYINANRTKVSNTLFSVPYPGYDISGAELVQHTDIINLHWVSQFQSPVTLKHLFSLGKPVVWTLHDQWAFTGGCHYSGGCKGYGTDCSRCPQLAEDPFSLPERILRDKETLFQNGNITIVTPSQWMGRCARESVLFRSSRVEMIPNSLETDLYSPLPKGEAKKRLGIPEDAVTFLFGAIDGSEKRKGFAELSKAICFCREKGPFQALLEKDRLRLLCFGNPSSQLEKVGIPVVSLGRLGSDDQIRELYSAADIFLLPSLEDNLPNTVLESMSCGTPVVAFDVGGVSDMVSDGVNGFLIRAFDTQKMAEAIVTLLWDAERRVSMGEACRRRAVKDYALDIQAGNYFNLYEDLLCRNHSSIFHRVENSVLADGPENEAVDADSIVRASLDTSLGDRFDAIYDRLLFQALKFFTPHVYAQLNASEDDRDKRLAQVKRLTDLLESSEVDRDKRLAQVKRLTDLLEICESDRDKRLAQVKRLTDLLESSEVDRDKRLAQVKRLTDLLEICESDREARLEQLEICEADRSARLDLINSLAKRKNGKKFRKQLDEYLAEIEELKQQQGESLQEISELKQQQGESLQEISELKQQLDEYLAEIKGLKQQLEHETQRALQAEQGWQALENTHVVRKARRLGIIKVEKRLLF